MALPRIPSIGVTDAVEILVFLIWQLLRWLLSGCKNSQERPRATYLRRGSPALLPVLTGGGSTNRATWAAEPVALPNSPRLIHNCAKESKLRPARVVTRNAMQRVG